MALLPSRGRGVEPRREERVMPNYRLDRTGGWQLRTGQGVSMIGIKCFRLAFPHSPPGGQPER
jgi:hypothetical protein